MSIKNICKRLVLLVLILCITVTLMFSFLLFKLYTGPVSLGWVKSYINNQVNNDHISVQISDISVVLDKVQKVITLDIKGTNLSDLSDRRFMINAPTIQVVFEAKMGLYWLSSKLIITSPIIYIDPVKVNVSSFFVKTSRNSSNYKMLFSRFFTEVIIQGGRVEFVNENRIMRVNANVKNQYIDKISTILAEVKIDNTLLKANIARDKNKTTKFSLQVTEMPVSLITKIMNGYDNFNNTQALLKSLNIKGVVSECKGIDIDNANLQFNNSSVHITKDINIQKNSELKVSVANFSTDYLKQLWPDWIGNQAKKWVLSHISSGIITRGTIWIDMCSFQEKCIKLIKQYKPKMPLGMLRVENVDLTYLEEYESIKKIYGTVTIDENGVLINGIRGMIGQSALSKTLVRIPYNLDNNIEKYIVVKGKTEGPIIDLISFIPEENINKATKYNINLREVKGQALTDVNIKIPIKSDLNFEDIIFNISSKFSDVSLDRLPNNGYLDKGELQAKFNGKKTEVLGQAKLDRNPVDINWVGYIEDNTEYDAILKLKTEVYAEHAKNFTIFDDKVIKSGKIIINTNITTKNDRSNINIDFDLKDAEFVVFAIGFKKNLGESITGIINARVEDENTILVKKFFIKGGNTLINGNGEIDKALLLPNKLHFDQIKFLKNDFIAEYEHNTQSITLNIRGKSLDFEQMDLDKISKRKDNAEFPIINSHIKLDKIYMKNSVIFNNVEGELECGTDSCKKGSFFAKMGKDNYNYLKIRLVPKNFLESIFTLEADNASLVLNAFNIYKNIRDGILLAYHIKQYDIENKNSVFKGKILMQDFIAIKTPVLAKLLTFSSLPGIVRLLGDNYISFKELTGNLHFKGNVLNIYNGNITGNELGLTMEGYVNIAKREINVEGTIVPEFYSLNRTLAALPIVGNLITGGKKNKGVFAANYNITGDLSNVKTSLNPISLFTPGFLRGIFNVFRHNKRHPQL